VQHLYAVSIGGSCLPSQSFRLSFPHLLPRVCERSNLSEEIAIMNSISEFARGVAQDRALPMLDIRHESKCRGKLPAKSMS